MEPNLPFIDGSKVKTIVFQGVEPGMIHADENRELILRIFYYGDRDEIWIHEIVDGKETQRHNVKYLESIVWKD